MRPRLLVLFMTCVMASLTASAAFPVPVTFSGTVTYGGTHTGDSLYVAVIDMNGVTTLGFTALAADPPPFSIPYSVDFDNTAAPPPVLLVAVLDIDGSGVDPGSLDTITNSDVVGWYNGHIDPVLLDTDASRTGLDFGLPLGEISGNVTFAPDQTWARVEPFSIPNSWSPVTYNMDTSGSYAIFGLYEGSWKVRAKSESGEICFDGDPTCVNPTIFTLATGQVKTGIDFDFTALVVGAPLPQLIESLLLAAGPNPANGSVDALISLPGSGEATLAMHDILGRQVMERTFEASAARHLTVRIGTAELPAGLYWLTLRHRGATARTRVSVVR